ALYTTEDINLTELLAPFGLQFSLRQAQASDDIGGKKTVAILVKGAHLGVVINKNQGKVIVAQVLAHSSAAQAGLSAGDEIIAIEHTKVDTDTYEKILKNTKP
ncbi:MAG TPA: PDZ domain-containing protein, partial [Candidatus Berkiella sp.]|nr:PDZ domain-containing protein [Candidatus Berkiella sp.]